MPDGRAIIVSDYLGGDSAATGGAGHAALDSFRALRAAGADVRVVAGFGSAPDIERSRFASLGGGDLRTQGARGALRTIYNRDAGDRMARELAHEDPATTLVILHQWTRYLSPAALGALSRFPTMIYMHDYFWPCPNGAYYDFQQARPCDRQPMGARCLAADCDRQGRGHKAGRVLRQAAREAVTRGSPERRLFLHLSQGALHTAAPLLPHERHVIVHNPLVLPEAAPPAAPPARYDVGYFGRIEPEKGVGQLFEAIARLDVSGLLVGEGSMTAHPPKGARIVRRAWQARATMADAMRSCRVVVLPSLWNETWGLIVPEAMAAGVPVLVSTRAGSAELVACFGGGATFDPGIKGDLAAKLAGLLARDPAPTRERAAMRVFLSPERHAARILDLAQRCFGIELCSATQRRDAA